MAWGAGRAVCAWRINSLDSNATDLVH